MAWAMTEWMDALLSQDFDRISLEIKTNKLKN
jgi:hypothetical protein